ncbi:MAG: DUF4351 domain-containing protein [Cyanobacteria bacterium P01_F01_bin.150]
MIENRADYDSPWKLAIERYFQEFMQFFFPHLAPEINWRQEPEFLDKDLQKIVRDADIGRRWADKLVKVWLKDGSETWLLVHVEVQSQYQADFAERMYAYNYRLQDRYDRPVASLAVLADESEQWRPQGFERKVLGCELSFRFPMVKLLDYGQQWSSLEDNLNRFATVVMAHLKARETREDLLSRKDWKLRLTRRLYERGYDRQDILELYLFIDWLIELPQPFEEEFQQELAKFEGEKEMQYISTIERQGIAKGIQQGLQQGIEQGERAIVLRLLNKRFSELSDTLIEQVNQMSSETLETLGDALLDFQGQEDLEQWLIAHGEQNTQN